MALDTLAMQRRLVNAGLNDQLAGAITREIADSIADEITAKPDLSDLRDVRNELQAVRNELQADIIQVRDEVAQVRGEVAQVRGEVAQVRDEVAQVRGEVARLESRMAEMSGEMSELKAGVTGAIARLTDVFADYKVSSSRWTLGTVAAIALGFAGIVVAIVLAA